MEMFWIGLGGALGANLRYAIGKLVAPHWGTGFPWGTGLVNVTGAFLIGIIATILAGKLELHPTWRLLLVVGTLGGYTTFSSFALETTALIQDGRWAAALSYVIGSNLLGILACFLGIWLARALGFGA